jgi:hypothetical protein
LATVHKLVLYAAFVAGGLIFSAALDALVISDIPDYSLAFQDEAAHHVAALPYAIGFFALLAFIVFLVFGASIKIHAAFAGSCLAYIAKLYFWG